MIAVTLVEVWCPQCGQVAEIGTTIVAWCRRNHPPVRMEPVSPEPRSDEQLGDA